MSTFHGKDGSAELGSSTLSNVVSWTISVDLELVEVFPYGTTNTIEYDQSYTRWTADVTCKLDSSGLDVNQGDTGELKIKAKALSPKFYGQAICSGIYSNGNVGGVPEVTYRFIGNGELNT